MARAGMNPKTLQYLMGHSDISITMNTYTHLGLDDAKDEMIRLKELEEARRELEKTTEKPKPATQNMFRAVKNRMIYRYGSRAYELCCFALERRLQNG